MSLPPNINPCDYQDNNLTQLLEDLNLTGYNISDFPTCNVSGYNHWLGYAPNPAANYAVLALFALLTIIVTYLTFWKKTWFLLPVTIGGCMEVIGYAARIPSATGGQGVFIISQFGIILAPTVYAMASYATMSTMMSNLHIKHPICTPFVVRWAFLGGDISSLFVQAAGGGLTVSDDPETVRVGTILLLTGLCMVLSVFVLFMFLTFYMHVRYFKMGKETTSELLSPKTTRMMFTVLYLDMLLLIMRSVYRVVEFGELKYRNPISTNETLFYALDALPILLFHTLWIPFHPGLWGLFTPKKDGKKSCCCKRGGKDYDDDKAVEMESSVN